MKYAVIYEQGPQTWGAYVPDLPGCVAAGDTLEEVQQLIRKAVEMHLEGLREENLPVPRPASRADEIEAQMAAMEPEQKQPGEKARVSVVLRIPGGIVERIDRSVKARPIPAPRHTWLLEAVMEKLDREGAG